jgi:L-lysine 2,3-aminomutase
MGLAFRSLKPLLQFLGLSPETAPWPLLSDPQFPLLVPRAFAGRMRKGDWFDPLLLQVLPLASENVSVAGFNEDAVGDVAAQCAPGVLHKYANRALLLPTSVCAVHCRYCFRRHYPYHDLPKKRDDWEATWRHLENSSAQGLEEIILSGGDPLSLEDNRLRRFWERAATLPHIRNVRMHTRVPVVLPSRIDDPFLELTRKMAAIKPVVFVIHANHAQELDGDVAVALASLRATGAVLLNQSVLLRGVNDSVPALKSLSQRLLDTGVLPYYLHLLDRVAGAAHFEVEESVAQGLIEELRLQVQGYLVPRLVREIAGEGSKHPF